MSLVHDALDRLPERQTLDHGLANPLAPKQPNKTRRKIAWPAVVVVALIIIIGAQAISLYRSGVATQSNPQGADTAVKTTTIATTVVTPSAIPATAAPNTTREISESASNAATPNNAALPAVTAGVVKSPAVVTSQIVSTLIAAPAVKNAPPANSNTAPFPTSPPVVMAEVATKSPIAVTPSETSLSVATPTVAVLSTVTENAITTTDNTTLKDTRSVTVASFDTLSKPTAIEVVSNTDSDLAVAQMPAVISGATVLPSPKANVSVSAKNTAETLQQVIGAAADAVNSGNVAAAEVMLKNALDADPDSLALTLALARFWIKAADYRSALWVLQNSQDNDAMALRGLVYELQGDDSQAMQHYLLLAKAQSLPSSYQLRYAVLLENDGNVIAARQWYQEYLKQPYQDSAARLFAAQRLQQLSDLR